MPYTYLMTLVSNGWELHSEHITGTMTEEEVEGELASARKLKEYQGERFIIENIQTGDIRTVIIF